jgi:hypothetical protein
MSTITTINSTDQITNSRSVINTNFSNLNTDKMETSVLDTDTALAANSDAKVPSQKAIKTYVDTVGGANASTTVRGIVEEATQAEIAASTTAGATGARLFVNPGSTWKPPTMQVFTASGTYTKPSGISAIIVELVGGGGGGGDGGSAGGGAGAGGYSRKRILAASVGTTETVTIGAGGAGGASTGTAGGTTSFGSHCSATGGAATSGVGGGTGGAGSDGDINITGGSGSPGIPGFDTNKSASGTGGASYFGGGGAGVSNVADSSGNNGVAYGSGGSGSIGTGTGGTGAGGICIVTEFY